jgi:CubicO group peptidase (beta-lactamase class C family)
MLSTVQRVLARVQRSPVTKRAYSVEASDKIDAFVQRFNASKYAQELSGYSLSVVRLDNKGSSVVKHYTYGSADVEKKVPVTETTSFRIGSISKTMTALCSSSR